MNKPAEVRTPAEPQPHRLAVDVREVSLTFDTADGKVEALSNVSLQIADGEFVSFIGPSGCGKTTMLRVIADLQQPTSGTLLRQRHERGTGAAGARLRLCVPGAGAVSVADHREQSEAAARRSWVFPIASSSSARRAIWRWST